MVKASVLKELDSFLTKDLGKKDVTSSATPNKDVVAVIHSNSQGILAGGEEIKGFLKKKKIKCLFHVKDGDNVFFGNKVATLEGKARDILSLERTILNVLSRMSGVATITRQYVNEVVKINSSVKVAATRKTSPGFGYFDKKAVVVGGGVPHRMGLHDMVLIKDNHLILFGSDIKAAVKACKKKNKGLKVEVEVSTLEDAVIAAKAGAHMILLDNMTPKMVRETINSLVAFDLRDKVLVEASGGIKISNVVDFAKTGVDWISIGELTRSPIGLDYSLNITKVKNG